MNISMFILHVANQIVTKQASSSQRSFFYPLQQAKFPSSKNKEPVRYPNLNPQIPHNTLPQTTHRSPPNRTTPAQLSCEIPQKPTPRTISNPETPKSRNKTPRNKKKKKKKITNRDWELDGNLNWRRDSWRSRDRRAWRRGVDRWVMGEWWGAGRGAPPLLQLRSGRVSTIFDVQIQPTYMF